jgi:hypothetical protein
VREHRAALAVLATLGILLSGFALTVDYPAAAGTFWSDAATYHGMAHSLAEDLDLRFTRDDVERVYAEFPSGPSGIFLKRGRELDPTLTTEVPFLVSRGALTDEIFFAKAFLYSLAAAPMVSLFGTNGLLLLHALLVTLVLATGYFFIVSSNRSESGAALGVALTYFFASAAPAYFVWLTPELFNFALVFLGAFFWLYKERAKDPPPLLSGLTSDLIAAAIWGAVTYSKPNNILLVLPLIGLLLYRRKWKRAVVTACTFGLFLGGLFLAQLAVTGEMNYQGGDRKTFSGRYPFQQPELTFDNTGLSMRTDVIYTQQPWDIVLHDLYLFYVGRFSGMAIYFFPAAFATAAFLLSRDKRLYQWLVLGIATLGGLLLMVWTPTNYFGGAGTIGNRYFMTLFPLYFFLIARIDIGRAIVHAFACWGVAAVFLTSVLVAPFQAGRHPGKHAMTGPYKLLPVEMSGINHLPTNSDSGKFRQKFDDSFLGYFLDDNAFGRERRSPGGLGFHIKGGAKAELVVRTRFVLDRLIVRVTNVTSETNRIEVCVPSGCETMDIEPGDANKAILTLPAGEPFPYEDFGLRSYCYLVSIRADKGAVPLIERRGESDRRYLGAFVHIETDPYPGI